MDIVEDIDSRMVEELACISQDSTGSETIEPTWWRVVLVGDKRDITLNYLISLLEVEVRWDREETGVCCYVVLGKKKRVLIVIKASGFIKWLQCCDDMRILQESNCWVESLTGRDSGIRQNIRK
jgi:hypothetical protein